MQIAIELVEHSIFRVYIAAFEIILYSIRAYETFRLVITLMLILL